MKAPRRFFRFRQCPLRTLALFGALCAAGGGIAHAATAPSRAEIYFRLEQPCPATGQTRGACPGYVIDRIIPLVCGGADDPPNMRWLTVTEARAKAKWERIGCRPGRKLVFPGPPSAPPEAFGTGESPEPVKAQPLPP